FVVSRLRQRDAHQTPDAPSPPRPALAPGCGSARPDAARIAADDLHRHAAGAWRRAPPAQVVAHRVMHLADEDAGRIGLGKVLAEAPRWKAEPAGNPRDRAALCLLRRDD